VQSAPQPLSFKCLKRLLACLVAFWMCGETIALAQVNSMLNAGPDGFALMDFSEMYLDQMNRKAREGEKQKAQDKELIDSGAVSALDLEAPMRAVEEYNHGSSLIKAQNSKEAIKYLEKAIGDYPKFVSAHIGLGLAYADLEDTGRAKSEFEAAVKLDDKFPGSFLRLGQCELSLEEFGEAQSTLEKAALLRPKDARILSTLAYAENGNHQYQQAVQTAQRVHALNHKGLANVHYVAAAAALALNDFDTTERELNFFISEDPTNAFAPVARQNLAALAHNRAVRAAGAGTGNSQPSTTEVASLRQQTFPNTDRLKAQLSAAGEESDAGTCENCGTLAEADPVKMGGAAAATSAMPRSPSSSSPGIFTIRKSVDDVALFFSVSSHGHMVNDLEASDIQIRDDNKPPERVVQFAPQSKLPLRLALLVDTSGSVHDRFAFEKGAATKFVQKMVTPSDLGFIAGFSSEPTVTQDFSSELVALGNGIDKLSNGGGTAVFDAVFFACEKLAEYPESERVARVLVILSDGEDNSSHITLKQSIQVAEKTGVTIYTVSTREDIGDKTDADRVLEVLAERTGGESMFPGSLGSLGSSLDKLRELIRSRYFIAYKPADFQPNGSYRTISVIAEKNGKRLEVRARKGYRTRLETNPN
jgi:Ca-activated chloride channel homolog